MAGIVFVVGAGASQELKLPLGSDLRGLLAARLRIRFNGAGGLEEGSRLIYSALSLKAQTAGAVARGKELNSLIHASRQISEAMPLAASIDSFLESRKGDPRIELCGKLAIVETILAAERASALYTDPRRPDIRPDQISLQGTWLNGFWQVFTEAAVVSEMGKRSRGVTIVNFNYDRCVERFMYLAFQDYYAMQPAAAATAMQGIKIYHPYGSVGLLPWMLPIGQPAADFGEESSVESLSRAAESIKTFSEGVDPASSDISDIRMALQDADRIVFLGFAFHRQNMKLLWPRSAAQTVINRAIYGTAKGISESDVKLVASELSTFANCTLHQIWLKDIECHNLFHQFRRSLSLV